MTLTYDEEYIVYDVINFDYDGNEIINVVVDPATLTFHVTYVPTKSITGRP